MNVATIDMPADLARAAYHQYRAARLDHGRATKEDRAIEMGYKAMAQGKAVIDLHDAIRNAGLDEQQRPRLAFGRAHWTRCWLRARPVGSPPEMTFAGDRNDLWHWRAKVGNKRVRLPGDLLPGVSEADWWCVVPTVPPSVRPRDLTGYHLLWEAAWQAIPVDPMLLKHLDGSLYVVLAVWDLTPLERAVLKGRLTQR